jgi:hypothetical protein
LFILNALHFSQRRYSTSEVSSLGRKKIYNKENKRAQMTPNVAEDE